MSNLIDFSSFKPQTFSICLRQFYRKLDRTDIAPTVSINARKEFFLKTRGEFLAISRKKKNISIEVAAHYLNTTANILTKIEGGEELIHDSTFLKLCRYYGTTNDAYVLTLKITKALNPNLRVPRGRKELE
jgi:plasmid maintenance system antidote protein VapI